RLVPGDRRVRERQQRVLAQVLELVVGGHALRDRDALVRRDGAALALVLVELYPPVVVVGPVRVRLVRLHPVEVDEQQGEQHDDTPADPAERSFHRTTSVARPASFTGPPDGPEPEVTGRLDASEIRSRRATSSQLAMRDEPPADRNGVVWPVSGI